tara:strand:+ start:371 stop:784 length:414 start_codon:yes stop_codon:yes gene_type:complete
MFSDRDFFSTVLNDDHEKEIYEIKTAILLKEYSTKLGAFQAFPWWPSEHISVQLLNWWPVKNTSTNLDKKKSIDILETFDRLSGHMLTAHYDDGETLKDPIISLHSPLRDNRGKIDSVHLRIHPVIWIGYLNSKREN